MPLRILQKRLAAVALITAALPFAAQFLSYSQQAHALEQCEQPIRRFTSGHGRRPGATVVAVSMRQQVKDVRGEFVTAGSERTLAHVTGNAVQIRVYVNNESIYDIGSVEIQYAFRHVPNGPALSGITDVSGAAYIPNDHEFVLDRVPSGSTVEFSFTMLLDDILGSGIAQSSLLLHDFMVLDSESRFPERLPETSIGRNRTTIEKIGIGGKEVSCFTADEIVRVPGTIAARVPQVSLPPSITVTDMPKPKNPISTVSTLSPQAIIGKLAIDQRFSPSSPMPGNSIRATITVRNNSMEALRGILVDDRFDADKLNIRDAGGGSITVFGIQWLISELTAGDSWSVTSLLRASDALKIGDVIPATVSLFSDQLLDVPVTQLSKSSEIVIVGRGATVATSWYGETPETVIMPVTGASFGGLFSSIIATFLGVILGCAIFFACAWAIHNRLLNGDLLTVNGYTQEEEKEILRRTKGLFKKAKNADSLLPTSAI